jgi:serine/threonine protein kinase
LNQWRIAHQKGIIHRDIKPSNVLVADHDGMPVVIGKNLIRGENTGLLRYFPESSAA